MANRKLSAAVQFIRSLADSGRAAELPDGQLLQQFIDQQDEVAFRTLVQRHGPLVLSVCQRVLHNVQDAEDVFQATFLVLVHRAKAIVRQESVGSWLHGVAQRIAVRAKGALGRRRKAEGAVPPRPAPDSLQEVVWRDLRLMLDEEVQRLPSRCRVAFVLCYMEGKTNAEAALILGCPRGTILSRLAHARELLRARLARRGLCLSGGLVVTMLSQHAVAAVPPALAVSTVQAASAVALGQAAAGVVSANVAALTQGVLHAMLFTKLQIVAAVLLGACGICFTTVAWNYPARADAPPTIPRALAAPVPAAQERKPEAPQKPSEKEQLEKEIEQLRAELKKAQELNKLIATKAKVLGELLAKRRTQEFDCTLVKVDVVKNTVTVTIGETRLKLADIALDADAKFYLNRKECSIDDLKEGMTALLQVKTEADRSTVIAIKANKAPEKKD